MTDDLSFSNPHSAILIPQSMGRAAPPTFLDGYAVCARRTGAFGRARGVKHRPGREKNFFRFCLP